ncbi:hypothetical protein IKF04_02450 [Candidatus Saccharibacteria bacterium]|nr:hypothetical protein [Candidatus Saccharibacteria bacterium]
MTNKNGDPGASRVLLTQNPSAGRRLKISKASFEDLLGSYGGRTTFSSLIENNRIRE